MKESGSMVEEKYPGIYYIRGNILFDTQIIVTGRLSQELHSGLRILSGNAREEDIRRFLMETRQLKEPGDRNNVDAVLQVSISANRELYQEIRRDLGMCEALRELMKDEIAMTIAEEREKALAEGREEGREKGADSAILSVIKNLMETMKWTVDQAMEAIKVPVGDRNKYASRL